MLFGFRDRCTGQYRVIRARWGDSAVADSNPEFRNVVPVSIIMEPHNIPVVFMIVDHFWTLKNLDITFLQYNTLILPIIKVL